MWRRERILASLGDAVRTLRLKRGLSQEGLAEAAGLHRTYVGSIERGERNVTLTTIVRLAHALDADASDLLRGLGR